MKITKYWEQLIGNEDNFSIEERTFHGICVIAASILLISIPINFSIGLNNFGIIVSILLAILTILFFLSRKARYFKLAKYIFALCIYIVNILSYFFNVGIEGTTIIVFILSFNMIISIMPKRSLWVWLLLHSALAASLLIFEYYYAEYIIDIYADRASRFIDVGSTFVIALIALFLLTKYLKNNYLQEQSLAKKRLDEIEEINVQINIQKKELELSNATKDKFFSIIAHDLISPFNSIIGFTDLLDRKYDKYDDETRKLFIHEINQSSNLTLTLLKNLLSWARSQTNSIQINIENIKLTELIDSVISPYIRIAANKNISIENTVEKNIHVGIDIFTISTVLANLINNSIKFTETDGKVTVSYKELINKFQIIVSDNGQGISHADISNLFEINSKISTTGTKGEKGTGLGLILCKEFVDLNKGQITVESEVGKGSTFIVCLPKHN